MSKPASVSFDFENLSGSDIAIQLGSVNDSDNLPITQYRFTTPYEVDYKEGTTQGFTVNGSNYTVLLTRDVTPQELANIFTTMGEDDEWNVDVSDDGNVFYVNSNSNIYTRLLLV